MMTKEEIRFQVALSCIQGVLEAKHGMIGEILPSVAVAESLRIADEFVKQWFKEEDKEEIKKETVKEEPLMEKPTNIDLYSLCFAVKYGREMRDESYHAGETTWKFPIGVKEKIQDDKKYFVWYDYHDAADPCDTSISYTVYYIE